MINSGQFLQCLYPQTYLRFSICHCDEVRPVFAHVDHRGPNHPEQNSSTGNLGNTKQSNLTINNTQVEQHGSLLKVNVLLRIVICVFEGSGIVDLSMECAGMLEKMMLAQAQECMFENSIAKGSTPCVCSKIPRQICYYYCV
ncbi:hypothetical protein RIF29_39302 [Crotalaria pallida]|uniref:BRO1 domain-containing protein n=1 Tax=Crotalaria pallida TaxID=3830 RepID=A0AAN9E1G2_CROPI